jgi:putative salt-induced outer membrane protein YdiY
MAAAGAAAQDIRRLPPIEELPGTFEPGTEWAPPAESVLAPPADVPGAPTDAGPVEPPPPPPKLWAGSFDLGLNGSEGNSQVFNFRYGMNATRTTPGAILTLKSNYIYTKSSGDKTANRLFFDGRHEWLLGESPWGIYVHQTTEWDEFKAFDIRWTFDTGLSYHFIRSPRTNLVGRVGPGVSQEIGGPDEEIVPELVIGTTFDHQISDRQKVSLSADYYPAIDDFNDYRLVSQGAWEILLDDSPNLSLKLSVSDRYDSTPQGAKANDLDYAATLVWSF